MATSGPEPGPNFKQVFGAESNNFSVPEALGCECFSRGSLEATVSICTFVSTSHSFGARMVTTFGARIPGPNGTAFRGPNQGPNQTTFRGPDSCACFSRGSLEATVSVCTFVSTSHLFEARMVYDFSGAKSGTRMEQLFGARIGARIEQLFGALGCGCFSRGSLEGTVSICTFVSTSHLFGARMARAQCPNGTVLCL